VSGTPVAVVVEVLEKLVAGDLLAAGNDVRQPTIRQFDAVTFAALAAEFETELRTADIDVLVAHRRQAE